MVGNQWLKKSAAAFQFLASTNCCLYISTPEQFSQCFLCSYTLSHKLTLMQQDTDLPSFQFFRNGSHLAKALP